MKLEKDKVKTLIDQAMSGLESSGRIENSSVSKGYFTPQATNEIKSNDAETQATHTSLDNIQSMIEK